MAKALDAWTRPLWPVHLKPLPDELLSSWLVRLACAHGLFECLQSWRDKGQWKPSIEEFMTAMDAPSSCRKDFGNLRMRIIEPAITELREKESLVIEWEADRAGRKVIGLVFKFRSDPQGRLDL